VAYQAAARIGEHEVTKKPVRKNDLGEQKWVRKVSNKMWVEVEAGKDRRIEASLARLQLSMKKNPLDSRTSSASNIVRWDGVYMAYANGIVRDTSTGLEWKVARDRDTNWEQASSWIKGLNRNGADWRMPTIDELKSLYRKGAGSRNMTPLLKTTGWIVWSGETKGSSSVRDFNFSVGYGNWGSQTTINGRAFAVRSRSDG
jgi:hypothetical protein